MSELDVLPELKQIIGAMLFVAKQPLTVTEMKRIFSQVAQFRGGPTADYAKAGEKAIREAIAQLKIDLEDRKTGMHLTEMAGGIRLENDANCGPWLRQLLQKGRPNRLSRPALETLAIIAYRQPCVRSEIEAVRGVAVDQILRNLLELQLIRVVGRSELPGKPWQFGTTSKFLEHFGLKSLDDLPGADELRRLEKEQMERKKASETPSSEEKETQEEAEEGPQVSIDEAVGEPAEEPDEKAPTEPEDTGATEADEEPDAEDEFDDDDEDEYDDEDDDEEDEDDEEERD